MKHKKSVILNTNKNILNVDKEELQKTVEEMDKLKEVVTRAKALYANTKANGELLPKFLEALEKTDKELADIITDIVKKEEPALWEKDSYMQQVILTGLLNKALIISTKYDANPEFIEYINELLSYLRYDFMPIIWLNVAVDTFIPKLREVRYLLIKYYNEYYKEEGEPNE